MHQEQELLLENLSQSYLNVTQSTIHNNHLDIPPHMESKGQDIITTYTFHCQSPLSAAKDLERHFYVNWNDQNNFRYFTCEEGEEEALEYNKYNGQGINNGNNIDHSNKISQKADQKDQISIEKSLYYKSLTLKLQQALKKIKENIQKTEIIHQATDSIKKIQDINSIPQIPINIQKPHRFINTIKNNNSPQQNKIAQINKNRIYKITQNGKFNSNTGGQFMQKVKVKRSYSLDHNHCKENMFSSRITTESSFRKLAHVKTQAEDCQDMKCSQNMNKKGLIQKYFAKEVIAEQIFDKKKKNLQWVVQIGLWQQKKIKKMQQKIQLEQQIKMKGFTFTPQINLKSRMIMKKKGTITPIYHRQNKDYKDKRLEKPEPQRFHKIKN